jgi:hypothetical protein
VKIKENDKLLGTDCKQQLDMNIESICWEAIPITFDYRT